MFRTRLLNKTRDSSTISPVPPKPYPNKARVGIGEAAVCCLRNAFLSRRVRSLQCKSGLRPTQRASWPQAMGTADVRCCTACGSRKSKRLLLGSTRSESSSQPNDHTLHGCVETSSPSWARTHMGTARRWCKSPRISPMSWAGFHVCAMPLPTCTAPPPRVRAQRRRIPPSLSF